MGVMETFKEIEIKAQEGQVGLAAELQAEYQRGWDESAPVNFKLGQESIVLPDPSNPDKIYTQADMDNLATIVRGEKDAEYAPQLTAKDEVIASKDTELASVRAELEALKADFDAKVVNGAMDRVDNVKLAAGKELDEAKAAIEGL